MHQHLPDDEQQVERALSALRPKAPAPQLWAAIEARLGQPSAPSADFAPEKELSLDEERRLEQVLGQLRPRQPRPEVAERVLAVLDQSRAAARDPKIVEPSFRSLTPILKVAAIVLLSLGILSLLTRDRNPSPEVASHPSAPAIDPPSLPVGGTYMPVNQTASFDNIVDRGVTRKGDQLYRVLKVNGKDTFFYEMEDGKRRLEVEVPKEEEVLIPVPTF